MITEALRYVALGDSYTIGTSVDVGERWPNQLVAALERSATTGVRLELVANLGVNGFTSHDVIEAELPQLNGLKADFCTLLIGVNDVVQGVPPDVFRGHATAIVNALVGQVGPRRVLIVTTPDYTVTPAGGDFGDPAQQATAIRANNEILTALAGLHGIVVVDIHDISLEAATNRSLVAADGLHPSGVQYRRWVARIAPAVAALLGR